eukprot:Phypoly_transcript_11000.p1 GENE.Phypoly_transcript_11000~~Phypoly_transcript_11000.p1  ORF type:complete len:414 (+),score=24.43 Phypoly_transcript_11000:104-1243(+)
MKWTYNHLWIIDVILPPASALAYCYEVRAPEIVRTEFRFNQFRIIRTADFSLLKNIQICDDRWGVVITDIDRQKQRHSILAIRMKSIVVISIDGHVMSNSEEFCSHIHRAEYVPRLSDTYAINGNKIAYIDDSAENNTITLNIDSGTPLPVPSLARATPSVFTTVVRHSHAGQIQIFLKFNVLHETRKAPTKMIKWGDKLVLDAEDNSISVYDWKGNREAIFNNDINKRYLINVDWVRDFEVWNDHLVTSGQNAIRIWGKPDYMCIKQLEVMNNQGIKIVWNNMLAVTTGNDIVCYDWSGNVVQTFRGHAGSVFSLQFYRSHLISCGSVMDKTVRVWNARGECEAIFELPDTPLSSLVVDNTLLVTCASVVYVFDWNIT